jgi:hypothetical protein
MVNRVGKAKATHAITVRWYGSDSPQATETARNLNEANAEAYIRELLDKAPPLSPDQRARLAELLRPARVAVTAARLAELGAGDGAA